MALNRWVIIVTPASPAATNSAAVASVWPGGHDHAPLDQRRHDGERAGQLGRQRHEGDAGGARPPGDRPRATGRAGGAIRWAPRAGRVQHRPLEVEPERHGVTGLAASAVQARHAASALATVAAGDDTMVGQNAVTP